MRAAVVYAPLSVSSVNMQDQAVLVGQFDQLPRQIFQLFEFLDCVL